MQVNVFVSQVHQDGSPTQTLILPAVPEAAIPKHLQNIEWRYFVTTDSSDSVIGAYPSELENSLNIDGYMVLTQRTV